MKLVIMQFSLSPVISFLFGPDIPLISLFSNTPSLCSYIIKLGRYLYRVIVGQTTSLTGNREKELQRRINLAWGKFWSLKFILLDKSINIKLRLEAVQTCVIPVLIYGSQTWTFKKR
jgi:hypothetical protein